MRELQLYPAKKQKLPDTVRKLQFVAGGKELAAWVNQDGHRYGPNQVYYVPDLYVCDIAGGTSRPAEVSESVKRNWCGEPAWSADGRYIVAQVDAEGEANLFVYDRHASAKELPPVSSLSVEDKGLFFAPDGNALIALRLEYRGQRWVREVARFELAQLAVPPRRVEERVNPFTGEPMRVPVYRHKWKVLIPDAPWQEPSATALSADGRFLAVADESGKYHVADLKTKRVTTRKPEEKLKRERIATRIGFDPKAEWVVRLAGGKLFAKPLAAGKPWRTKSTLGKATDFAFHPDGRFLCAVFADGSAKYLDPRTGAARQSFQWSKKPLHSVAFSPDGLTCAAGGENGQVVIWDVDA